MSFFNPQKTQTPTFNDDQCFTHNDKCEINDILLHARELINSIKNSTALKKDISEELRKFLTVEDRSLLAECLQLVDQHNFSCALNLIDQAINKKNTRKVSYIKEGEDHEPEFTALLTIHAGVERKTFGQDSTKVKALEKASRSMVFELLNANLIPWSKMTNSGWIRDLCQEGVEPNPGPSVNLDFLDVKDIGESYKITFPNQFEFVVLKELVKIEDKTMTYLGKDQNLIDEFTGTISRSGIFSENGLSLTSCTAPKILSYFGKTRNFSPKMRVFFKLTKTLVENCAKITEHGLPAETEGRILVDNKIIFVPKNLLRFKYSRSWYNGPKNLPITDSLIANMLDAVKMENLTSGQLIGYASRITTIQMINFDIPEKNCRNSNKYLSVYWKMFLNNVSKLKKGREILISPQDVFNFLFSKTIIVPTVKFNFGSIHEVFSHSADNIFTPVQKFSNYKDLNSVSVVKPYDFEVPVEQLLADFDSGLIRTMTSEFMYIHFAFNNKVPFSLRQIDLDLSPRERVLKKIIEQRVLRSDMSAAASLVLRGEKDQCIVRDFVEFYSKITYSPKINSQLLDLMVQPPCEGSIAQIDDYLLGTSEVASLEKKVAQKMQLEYCLLSPFLGCDSNKNIFNNAETIRRLFELRREKATNMVFEGLKTQFKEVKEIWKTAMDSKETLTEINTWWDSNKSKLNSFFSKESSVATTITASDFSSFKGLFSSTKTIVNALFDELLKSICNLFGVEYQHTIDATMATFYYIVWVQTDNVTLKYLIFLDILSSLGILDFVWKIVKSIWETLKSRFGDRNMINDDDLEKLLSSAKTNTTENYAKAKENMVEDEELNTEPQEDIGMLTKVLKIIGEGSVGVLGVVALVVVSVLGLKKAPNMTANSVGSSIVEICRNMGFVALGLKSVPVVFSYVVGIFKWVMDYAKKLFVKDHKTKMEKHEAVIKWMRESVYFNEHALSGMSENPTLCMKYFMLHEQMLELSKDLIDLDKSIAIPFAQRSKVFTALYQKVKAFLISFAPPLEMFHVQFTGEPGVGKTDVVDRVMEVIKSGYIKSMSNQLATILKVDPTQYEALLIKSQAFNGAYNLNETMKHMDGYYGQVVLRVDDTNVFKNVEPESVIQNIYVLSGVTTMAKMADLNEKGRQITSKIMISNTNNPFPKPQFMEQPKALWRRRMLVKVEVVFDFDDKAELNPQIEKWCKENNKDRTQCEHLKFSILDPVNESGVVKQEMGISLSNMTLNQFQKYMRAKTEEHFAREWTRVTSKNPHGSRVLAVYEAMTLEANNRCAAGASIEDFKKNVEEFSKARVAEFTKKLNKLEEENLLKPQEKSQQLREFEKINNLHKNITFDLAGTTRESRQNIGNEIMKAFDGSDMSDKTKFTQYELKEKVHNGETYYFLEPTTKWCAYEISTPDYSKLRHFKINGVDEYCFDYVDDDFYRAAVFSELVYIKSLGSVAHLYFKKQKSKEQSNSFLNKWLHELKFQTANILASVGQFTLDNTKQFAKFVGKSIVRGAAVAFSLLGLFFVCHSIGTLLAPPTKDMVAYSGKTRTIPIPGARQYVNEKAMMAVEKRNKFRDSQMRVYIPDLDCNFAVTALQGNMFITNYHNVVKIDREYVIFVADPVTLKSGATKKTRVSRKNWVRIGETDTALLEIEDFRATTSLLNHWMTESDLDNEMRDLRLLNAQPIYLRDEGYAHPPSFETRRYYEIPELAPVTVPSKLHHLGDNKERVLQIYGPVRPGDSGSLVLTDATRLDGIIPGLVYRGNTTEGYLLVSVVSREQIQKAMKNFRHTSVVAPVLSEADRTVEGEIDMLFEHGQRVKDSPYPDQSVSPDSGFRKSPIFGVFENLSYPAIQSSSDPRIPPGAQHFLKVSLNKTAGVKTPDFDALEEISAERFLYCQFATYHPEVFDSILLNTTEAITGTRNVGMRPMNLSSSAGLPYKLTATKGKSPFIKFDPTTSTYMIQERIFHDVNIYEEYARNGQIMPNIKLEFRKKELVGEKKILEPRTRTVGMGNLIHDIVYKKILKDFQNNTKYSWLVDRASPFAFGVNPEIHWNLIAEHLKYTDYVMDADVKSWDEKITLRTLAMAARVKLRILKEAYMLRGQKLPEGTEKILLTLAVDYIHSDVCFQDIVYEKKAGLLSGHPGTFCENTEIHEMILYIAVRRVCVKYAPIYNNFEAIQENVRSIKAADDIVIAISPLFRSFLTVGRLVDSYKSLGYDLTAADKTDEIVPKTLEDCQFLKSTFVREENGYRYCPNLSIIHQLLNWIRVDSAFTKEEQFRVNLENAMRFLFWRGEDEYEKYRSKINLLCLRNKIPFQWKLDFMQMTVFIGHVMQQDADRARMITTTPTDEDTTTLSQIVLSG